MERIRARCLRPPSRAGQASCLAVCRVQGASSHRMSWTATESSSSYERRRRFNIPLAVEASCSLVTAIIVAAGVSTTLTYLALRKGRGDDHAESSMQDKLPLEIIDANDFKLIYKRGNSASFAYIGSDARYQKTLLRLRLDDDRAAASDRAAALLLGQGLTSQRELVALAPEVGAALLDSLGCSSTSRSTPSGRLGRIAALKLASGIPLEACHESVVTIELQPGNGLVDLYGVPSSFRVQENSGLRKDSLARAGKYNARDIFSGRPDRLRRALRALSQDPEDYLRVFVNEVCILDGSSEGSLTSLAERLREEAGIEGGLGSLMELLADCLDSEGKALLMALLRAQCSAGPTTTNQAHRLYQVLRQRVPLQEWRLSSPDALEAAFSRGFWTLPANESGKDIREREGELLLERARRELWVEGSASRRELEAQIRVFLCRNLLGRAANAASVQLRIVRARPEYANTVRALGFVPATGRLGHGLWYRLDLVDFELPLESVLHT